MALKFGTFGDDVLNGTNGADTLQAMFGDDQVYGLGGDDILFGSGGFDTLEGGDGNDTLHGGGQDDTLDGGDGIDTAVYDIDSDVDFNNEENIAVSDTHGTDFLRFIENVTTGNGDDYVQFSATAGDANVIQTNGGADRVVAYGGNDVINAGAGNDEVDAGSGNDVVNGGSGNDELLGDAGDDTLNGGNNADFLWGNTAADVLSGGSGADDFAFREGNSGVGAGDRDEVTDFSKAQGDQIDLSEFGNLDFIGESAFSAPDQVRFFHSGGDTIVRVNTVGNSGAEMEIELAGIINLAAGDFVL